MQRKREMNRVGVREKEKLLGGNEKDKSLARGRKLEREREMEREGLVDPARYQEPPLPVAPIPRLYIPPVHLKSICIRVCGGENPHNIDVARP